MIRIEKKRTEVTLRAIAGVVAAAQPQLVAAFPQLTWLWTLIGFVAGATAFKAAP